jgi:hypothetical protein
MLTVHPTLINSDNEKINLYVAAAMPKKLSLMDIL